MFGIQSPYDNPVDPNTGYQTRPSFWQQMFYWDDAQRLRRQQYEQQQFARTDQPLATNPAYQAPGFAGSTNTGPPTLEQQQSAAKYGITNPYIRPSSATSFWHPETLKTWQAFENAPYENQLAANRLQTLGPIETQQAVDRAQKMIPVDVERNKQLIKAQDEHIDQTIDSGLNALQSVGGLDNIDPAYKNASLETKRNLIKFSPHYQQLYNNQMLKYGIDNHLPQLTATQNAAKLQAEQAKSEQDLAQLMEEQRLDVAKARARAANLFARTGQTPASIVTAPAIANVGDTSFTVNDNTQYRSPYLQERKDLMSLVPNLQNQAKVGALGAVGITPNIRPAMGFGGDSLSSNAMLPQSLQQTNAPIVNYGPPTLASQVSRPSVIQQPLIYGPPDIPKTAFGTPAINSVEFWNELAKKISKLAPKGSAANP